LGQVMDTVPANKQTNAIVDVRQNISLAILLIAGSPRNGVVAKIWVSRGGSTFTRNRGAIAPANSWWNCVDSRFFAGKMRKDKHKLREPKGLPRQELVGIQRGFDRQGQGNYVDRR
jgi:hypothetical protein